MNDSFFLYQKRKLSFRCVLKKKKYLQEKTPNFSFLNAIAIEFLKLSFKFFCVRLCNKQKRIGTLCFNIELVLNRSFICSMFSLGPEKKYFFSSLMTFVAMPRRKNAGQDRRRMKEES